MDKKTSSEKDKKVDDLIRHLKDTVRQIRKEQELKDHVDDKEDKKESKDVSLK